VVGKPVVKKNVPLPPSSSEEDESDEEIVK